MTIRDRVIVIGTGSGGLCAAVDLARRGADVTVLERAATPGGKMRQVAVDGIGVDAGPTVFTMRWIFEGLFADAGWRLADHLELTPAATLARHAWRQGGQLDLFADIDQSVDAIAAFSGQRDADGYRAFCARSSDIYQTLVQPFIASERPSSPVDLAWRVGIRKLDALWRTAPLKSMWSALSEHFEDPRLRQLFGRYATYCGSSPLLAPATLMLVAHVEQDGVWLVNGGMRKVADVLVQLAESKGARFRFEADVAQIIIKHDRAVGVVLTSGERLDADAVVFNGDASAIGTGLVGAAAQSAVAPTPRDARSLSAITWCMRARTSGFPLTHHNVFFAEDYEREFDAIFDHRSIPAAPTVYICAQDRGEHALETPDGPERLLVLINAPPDGDTSQFSTNDIDDFEVRTFELLKSCGLEVDRTGDTAVVTTPTQFNHLFPASGGALYGRASHGSNATFQRPPNITRIAGLYLTGGRFIPDRVCRWRRCRGGWQRIACWKISQLGEPNDDLSRQFRSACRSLPDRRLPDRCGRRDNFIEHFGGRHDTRQSSARMGARANKIKSFDLFARIMRSKPGTLKQVRLQREGSSIDRQQPISEVLRCHHERRYDRFRQARHQRLLQPPLNGRAIALSFCSPISSARKIWHRRQNVKRIAASGRKAWIVRGWAM